MSPFHYLSILSLNEFSKILELYDIHVSRTTQAKILRALRNNTYAIMNHTYSVILEDYICGLTDHQLSRNDAHLLIDYFKPYMNV